MRNWSLWIRSGSRYDALKMARVLISTSENPQLYLDSIPRSVARNRATIRRRVSLSSLVSVIIYIQRKLMAHLPKSHNALSDPVIETFVHDLRDALGPRLLEV